MLVYVMMIVTIGLPSVGMIMYFLPTMAAPLYYGTPENNWAQIIVKHIPPWLMPSDPNPNTPINEAVEYFFTGLPKGVAVPWASWTKPFLAFLVFSAVLYFIYFCLAIILRKQWVENERLSFPLVQFPEEIVKDSENNVIAPFFKNKLMWLGFAIPFLIHSYNIITAFVPSLSKIQLTFISLNFLFTEPPWTAMKELYVSIFFSVIGFSFLLPLEVSFSLWFFFLLNAKVQYALGSALGLNPAPGGQFMQFEQFGAYIVMIAMSIYYARKHLKDVVKTVFSRGKEDGLTNKIAFFGLISGVILITYMLSKVGVNPVYGLFTVLIFIVIIVILSRIVAEGGLYYVQQNFMPSGIISSVAGTSGLSPQTITMGGLFNWVYVMDLRVHPLPFINDGLKIAHDLKINRKKILVVMAGAILLGFIVSFTSFLFISYKYGGNNMSMGEGGWWTYNGGPTSVYTGLQNDLQTPKPATPLQFGVFSALGGLGIIIIMFMRQRFGWWPFHPVGYLMGFCSDYGPMWRLWFSVFLGWLIKASAVTYLGGSIYKKLRPIFLGFIVSEVFLAFIIAVLQMVLSREIYSFFP
ncbi:MAG: hypothetical protein A2536_04505 [Candidatus Firestonebacteria bacterium RIFOXYD2_FULL_39_29]|nr:MAG: hypothetical protein A2536_04505 [Candidatus Firestonebacteria bacterium RIFOXYD2_FULL_39_29]